MLETATRRVLTIVLVGAALLIAACNEEPNPPTPPAAEPAAPSADDLAAVREMNQQESTPQPMGATPGATAELPPGHPPIGDAAPATPPPAATPELPPGHPPIDNLPTTPPSTTTPTAAAGPLQYTAPESWTQQTPSSRMRVDQYALPAAEGDDADAELTVFHFPRGGGGLQANAVRWRRQFTTVDGQPIPDEAFRTEEVTVNDLTVMLVWAEGRFQGMGMGMRSAAPEPQDGYRMLGALVDTPGGLWTFKATGPTATIAAHADAFREFVDSFHIE